MIGKLLVPSSRRNHEARASVESPSVPITSKNILSFFGLDSISETNEVVTIDTALGVPAVWASVNFLSGTLASLPLQLFRRGPEGRTRVGGPLEALLHDATNDEMSSFAWRKYFFEQVFTHGRGLTFIERAPSGRPINLWPLDPTAVTVERRDGRTIYHCRDGKLTHQYESFEIIDLPFMLSENRLRHRSPILSNRNVIGLAQSLTRYGAKFFASGGIPPFALEGPFQTPGGMQRAADDLAQAVQKASRENRLALSLPSGHTIKPIGVDPEKSQLTEAQRFSIEQIARIYSLPPTFLQDLTNGTFSNAEQQDLHFTKHTLRRWITQFEQEVNLKLFGRSSNRLFVEMNVDGLLRGDFQTRMAGYAQGIQNAILTPNEVRRRENLPDQTLGDLLYVQGATVQLGAQSTDDQ